MSTQTTNIELELFNPATDNADITGINENMSKIDTIIGKLSNVTGLAPSARASVEEALIGILDKTGTIANLNIQPEGTAEPTNLVDAANVLADKIDILDNRDNYSTSEQVIGKWIDGKPIYRKVFECAVSASSGMTIPNTAITNIKQITKLESFAKTNGFYIPLPWFNYDNTHRARLEYTSSGLYFFSTYGFTNVRAIVEYTKTTD